MKREDVKGKKLRDELPREARDTYNYPALANLLHLEVVERHDGCEPGQGWPGPQRNVNWWFTLENGKRVGWNENPSTGWSFPVLGPAKPKK